MDQFLGQIALFGFGYEPKGWMFCDGRLLMIQQYTALFSILGTDYGGNGTTNFALPDLRGMRALGSGQGAGMFQYNVGETVGSEQVTLSIAEMADHDHFLAGTTSGADSPSPDDTIWAKDSSGSLQNYASSTNSFMAGGAIGSTGGGQAHTNLAPYTVASYCIAVTGIFPSAD